MRYDEKQALELLRTGSGILDAQFREGQEEAIRHVVEGRGKLLVVQKTGWGKSFVYFIATKLLREGGAGPALLISPLLSLMRNQIAAAERMDVRAATINSDNTDQWGDVMGQAHRGVVDILLISPERLANDSFREDFLPDIAGRVSMLVIDEAHCISDWGHDFRPDYRRIETTVRALPTNVQMLGTTATANNQVMDDLVEVLGPNIRVLRGDLNRSSLLLQTIRMPSQAERLAWLSERLSEIPGSGIIYTLTRRDANVVSRWLKSQGHNAPAYMGGSGNQEERAERVRLEDELLHNCVKALVATTALGMGFDKPDLAFVIHYQMPQSVEHYYQQVGRGIDAAYGVLLSGAEDADIAEFFISNAFPRRDEVSQILTALTSARGGLSVPELEDAVNVRRSRIEQAIKLLALESPPPIAKQGTKWQLTATPLSEAIWERAERLTALRQAKQQHMQHYLTLNSGHMEYLINALDGDAEAVQLPNLPPLSDRVKPETVLLAVEFLKRSNAIISPRRQWANRRRIPTPSQAGFGLALCYWGDAGWGDMVRNGKYVANRFDDQLVTASAKLIKEWNPQPAPTWVTCIPSQRHPDLVPDFAMRLASAIGLPFRPVLTNISDRPEQKTMENSAQQAWNVEGSLSISPNQVMPGAVLLVDDMVDSGWTFTMAAALLREHGCGVVFPFALADTGTRQG